MNTDKEIFSRIGEATRDGFNTLGNIAAKEYPLDAIFKVVMVHPRVVHLMLPLPLSNGGSKKQEMRNDKKREHPGDSQQVQDLKNQIKNLKAHKGEGNKGGGKGGGAKGVKANNKKGKDPRKDRSGALPKELIGMNASVDGKKVCYAYNMRHGCKVSGEERCEKGYHLCMFPGCGERHGLQSCPEHAKAVMKAKVH